MPRKKKSGSPKINKSAWIREQPASMPAKEVVAKAKAAGITLSVAQVYVARSTAKKAGGVAKRKGRRSGPKGTLKAGVSADLNSIKRAVFQHGFARVEAFVADLKRNVGL